MDLTPEGIAEWLGGRADSYSRDALTLAAEGDSAAIAFRAIASELRECADRIIGELRS